jgi:uncharacterized protein (DUF1800 family)
VTDPLRPWQPSAREPFDLKRAGHLLRRAGFGGPLRLRERMVREGVDAALQVVAPDETAASPADALLRDVVALGEIERVRSFRVWLCLQGQSPLRERTSLFWHHHFATSNRKLLDPRAMAMQQAMFDARGLGTFDELLLAACRDPALLRWLDNDTNVAAKPNENFARELFELFTLGRGNYTEQDVREAARAFTGWHVRDGQFHFAGWLHDNGSKQVFGSSGALGGEDIVRLCAERPESATFLARKWLCWFVHPEPMPEEVEALLRCYLEQGRHVGRTLRVLLRSELFFGARAFRSKVKSPADFVLGLVRGLNCRAAPDELARAMGRMGELWLEPPSVAGWPGERAWLNTATWLQRSNFAAELLAGQRGKLQPRPEDLLAGLGSPEERTTAALDLLLDGEASAESRKRLLAFARSDAGRGPGGASALLHATTALPEYQLL